MEIVGKKETNTKRIKNYENSVALNLLRARKRQEELNKQEVRKWKK